MTSYKKLVNLSQFDRDTSFPPIFVKELEYKCSESEDKMSGKWETKSFGEQKFGGNLPQPTRKLRSRKTNLPDIL